MALKAGRVGVNPAMVDNRGNVSLPQPTPELPEYSATDAGKTLFVNADGELEWDTPSAGGGGIYKQDRFFENTALGYTTPHKLETLENNHVGVIELDEAFTGDVVIIFSASAFQNKYMRFGYSENLLTIGDVIPGYVRQKYAHVESGLINYNGYRLSVVNAKYVYVDYEGNAASDYAICYKLEN